MIATLTTRSVPKRTIRTVRAFAEAFFSGPSGAAPAERIDWLCAEIDDFLSRAGPRARLVLRLALAVISLLAPLFLRRLPPLRRLSLEDRVAALSRMEQSWAAAPVYAVKAILCVFYYEHPDSAREVGYVGFGMPAGPERSSQRVAT